MSDDETTTSTDNADAVASMVSDTGTTDTPAEPAPETSARPDNVPEKFWDAEAGSLRTDDVLKSYGELEKQFGAFTGAPEDYSFNPSEDMTAKFTELGMEINTEGDPLYEAAMEFAKGSGMNQEGMDGLTNLYLMQQLADVSASQDFKAQEMKALGDRAETRVSNLESWGTNNLSPELYEQFKGLVSSADSVQVLEHLIAQTRNTPVSDTSVTAAPSISESDLNAMQFAKDDNGNRRIQTDPAFKAEFKRKQSQLYGDGENRIMVGG